MRLHRWEAAAELEVGRREGVIGGWLQLVTVFLTDGGPVVEPGGCERMQPDIEAHLRPREARELAFTLLMLAEQADRLGGP